MRYALALGAAALLLSTSPALANGLPPRPGGFQPGGIQPGGFQFGGFQGFQGGFQPGAAQPAQGLKLVIQVDEKAKVARLVIPRRVINPPAQPAQPRPRGFGQLSTMMVGTALAMSVALGGLWLVRKRSGVPGRIAPMLLLAVGFLGVGVAAAWADLAPPKDRPFRPRPQPIVPALPALPALATVEPIRIEYVAQGDAIRLILTPAMKANLGQAVQPAQPAPAAKPAPPAGNE
jgi:hypothetical protein